MEETEGRSFPVKTSLPIPGTSQDVNIQVESGPIGGKRAEQREMLRDYAKQIVATMPPDGHTLARVVFGDHTFARR